MPTNRHEALRRAVPVPKKSSFTVAKACDKWMGHKVLVRALKDPPQMKGKGKEMQHPDLGSPGIEFAAMVADVRYAYGRVQLLIKPVYGRGTKWIHSSRAQIVDEWPGESYDEFQPIEVAKHHEDEDRRRIQQHNKRISQLHQAGRRRLRRDQAAGGVPDEGMEPDTDGVDREADPD